MFKALVFDMDGTIANLYGVKNWLSDLQSENTRPYEIAEPFYNAEEITNILKRCKENGWQIIITTWLAKGASKEYDNAVRIAKKNWLISHGFPFDEIHCVKYGTTKANCTRKKGGFQILIDDNKKIRDGWTLGTTVNANHNIMNFLRSLA